ncbi:MAG: bifunctional pyr operon transcriptional regulator/uracil phosphoribosyltransferase PyrR [candidate division Zixibacteria bacterium]|nr:bifunctional pyr operon transcriptional regulator/uracil phosphoribosyltransferase PyrR [candidate division Zixibacteria bacterium]
MNKAEKREIMDGRKMSRAITRVAHEILERNGGAESLVIIGILTRGAVLAGKLAKIIKDIEGEEVKVGLMDINLYRDDVNFNPDQPVVRATDILFDVNDKNLILVDDVLFTGRTIRAALSQIIDFGRPKTVQLAVMVDRGHRQLPIRADYVGKNIPTAFEDSVRVYFEENDDVDEVVLYPASDKKTTAKKSTGGNKK